jgi:Trk-type K+ transport system membrane component
VPREQILDYTRPAPASADDLRPRDAGRATAAMLVVGYLAFNVLAVAGFHLPGVGVAGQEMSLRRTVFAAVNATTLTGFQQDVGSSLDSANVLRLVLTLGGTLFTLTAGGMAVVRIGRMNYTDGQVARAAAVATLAATVGGAAVLLNADRGLVASLLQSASAFGNSGLYAGRLPGVLDWRTHAVLVPLMFAGALGIPVLMELFDRATGARRMSPHSRTVMVLAAGVYLVGVGLLALFEGTRSNVGFGQSENDWRQTFALASTFSVDARTAGLPFEFADALSRPAQWVLVLLMVVGGAPGGTAGGLKTTTLWRLVASVRDSLAGRRVSRGFGIAASWATLYGALVLTGFLLLLVSEPDLSTDRLLFLAVSAASNVGLSHDPVSITSGGLYTLSALMLAGRLAPLFVLWWMASDADADDLVAVG